MTTHLGSFGTPRPAVDAAFDYFGVTIRVNPDASDLAFVGLMMRAQSIEVDEDDPKQALEAMNTVLDTVRKQIHPDDWDLFWATAQANRQQTTDLMVTSEQITSAVAGFPTGPSSVSRAGRRATARRSRAGSSSRASRDASRSLTLQRGRPDLQSAVFRAAEARAG